MPLFAFEAKRPRVHPTAFVAPTAVLVGDVTVEERASVWYNAVLRADFSPIVVRAGATPRNTPSPSFGCRRRTHSFAA